MDSCVIPLPQRNPISKQLFMVQSVDYFYPLVDNPYIMGKIACANVVSDIYALGVRHIDTMLMLMGICTEMSALEKEVVTDLMVQGFKDAAAEAGTRVTGGDTVINPWCTIGGTVTSVCTEDEFILPNKAQTGDVLVLTKPLGTQLAVLAHHWMSKEDKWCKISDFVSREDVEFAYSGAIKSMERLNRTGADLMHAHGAHGATDVTGFGILGHTQNLAKIQTNSVSLVIDKLPVIAKMSAIATSINYRKLKEGTAPETSGGLLVCLPRDKANKFCEDIKSIDNCEAWIIGSVVPGNKTAEIIKNPQIIEVPFSFGQ